MYTFWRQNFQATLDIPLPKPKKVRTFVDHCCAPALILTRRKTLVVPENASIDMHTSPTFQAHFKIAQK